MTHGPRVMCSTPPAITIPRPRMLTCVPHSPLQPSQKHKVDSPFLQEPCGVSREQQRHSCDVAVVFTGLVGTSHQYISNCRSIQLLISLEQFFKCQSG